MEINDINLGFLWEEKKTIVLDAPDPFWEKWEDEEYNYSEFIKTESLEKIIGLLIVSFKTKYPRDFWFVSLAKGLIASRSIYKDGLYKIVDGEHLSRDDLKAYKWLPKTDADDFEYDYERIFEFKSEIDLTQTVEQHLAGLTFNKTVTTDSVLFQVSDSPIAEIELTPKSFRMTINEDYYFLHN